MGAYAICFTLTTLFTLIANKEIKNNRKALGLLFSAFAIFVASFFAGARNPSVGIDANEYVITLKNRAINESFKSYWNNGSYVEIGFRLLIYILTLINNKNFFILFMIQCISFSCIYYFAYRKREDISMTLMIVTYLLTCYTNTYTIMRQEIATGFILLSLLEIEKKKKIKAFLLFLIAMSFHNSAILALIIYFLFAIMDSKKISKKYKNTIFIFTILIISAVSVNYKSILYFFTYKINILPAKYYNYFSSDFAREDAVISFSNYIERVILLLTGIIYIIKKKDDNEYKKYYLLLLIEAFLYFSISKTLTNADRAGVYFKTIGTIYCIPKLTQVVKNNKFNKVLICAAIIITMLVFWIWKYPIKHTRNAYPYIYASRTNE